MKSAVHVKLLIFLGKRFSYFWVENLSNLCNLIVCGSQTLGSTHTETQKAEIKSICIKKYFGKKRNANQYVIFLAVLVPTMSFSRFFLKTLSVLVSFGPHLAALKVSLYKYPFS